MSGCGLLYAKGKSDCVCVVATNRTRLVRKAKPADSFFNFFSPPVPPTPEQLEEGNFDEAELEEIENNLEIDYQIGEDFKEKVRLDVPGLHT